MEFLQLGLIRKRGRTDLSAGRSFRGGIRQPQELLLLNKYVVLIEEEECEEVEEEQFVAKDVQEVPGLWGDGPGF